MSNSGGTVLPHFQKCVGGGGGGSCPPFSYTTVLDELQLLSGVAPQESAEGK